MDAAVFTMDVLQAQNRALRARNEELEELVTQLKGEMGLGQDLPIGLPHLTCYEADMLRILIARKVVTRNAAMMAIYSDRTEMPHEKIVDIWVHRLRRKLEPLGIRIATIWGAGLVPDRRLARHPQFHGGAFVSWPDLIAGILAGSAVVIACVIGLGILGGFA